MKQLYLLLLALATFTATQAQNVYIPDANFKNYLTTYNCVDTDGNGYTDQDADINDDGEIQVEEAALIQKLDVEGNGISDLTGIESMINLTELNCTYNYLTSLDLTQNVALNKLFCQGNDLTTLNLGQNAMLTELTCQYNEITSLALPVNSSLTKLDCSNNNLSNIDVTSCVSLIQLRCEGNQLSSLNVTLNPNLELLICSNNSLTSLNMSQNAPLYSLDCKSNELTNLNISQNSQLSTLTCQANNLTALDVSQNLQLSTLFCSDNDILNLDVSQNINLESFWCHNNSLTSLDVSQNTGLTSLICSNNSLGTLNITSNTGLYNLSCNNIGISQLDISQNLMLGILSVSGNQLTTLDVGNHQNLQSLGCAGNLLEDLDVSQNSNLNFLNCSDNNLGMLDVSSNVLLSTLYAINIGISVLDLSQNSELEKLVCESNQITTLDLSENVNLNYLKIKFNPLESLFIKNGTYNGGGNGSYIDLPTGSTLSYICADPFELGYFESMIGNWGWNFEVNSYCSFTPGGEFYTIEGQNTIDEDMNGCDVSNPAYPYLYYGISDSTTTGAHLANGNGEFNIPLQQGTYAITPQLENPTYFSVSPSSLSVSLPDDGSPYLQDFCITPNGTFNDLEVMIVPLDVARPGFDADYKIVYKNKGTTSLSGNVNLNYDDVHMDLVSAAPVADSQSTGSLTWNFTNLNPFESQEIYFTMNLNTPIETTFPLNGGDILVYNVGITPVGSDETPSDNIMVLSQGVVNSYDPNDKTCLEGATIGPDRVGEYVHYMIRFENTGSASAINIVVRDEIDSNKFDITSLVPLEGSHDFETRIQNGDKVEFIFEGVNLPFDDANNDGYVLFKIKTLQTLNEGDTFSNDAEIYFDYNAPIITNDYQTSVQSPLSTNEIILGSNLNVYPNPVKNQFTIETVEGVDVESVTIYGISGGVVAKMGRQTSYDISEYASGVYIVELSTNKGTINKRIVKQ